MGVEVEVEVAAFDGTADVFDAAPAIAGNVEEGTVGEESGVGGKGAFAGFGAGGGDADLFGFAFAGAVGIDGLEAPVAFPTAADLAVAVAGEGEGDVFGFLVFGDGEAAGSGATGEEYEGYEGTCEGFHRGISPDQIGWMPVGVWRRS